MDPHYEYELFSQTQIKAHIVPAVWLIPSLHDRAFSIVGIMERAATDEV